MSAEDVLRRYCGTCAHREECWRPCFTALAALYTGAETVEQLEAALGRRREQQVDLSNKGEAKA